ncbi:MAG: hypothetical protein DRJ42_17665 [Deltaproteobacteria bacterium]|nr:MAG: hypothetical protein DRJ42_17665 [Deltaproteobacteria bacterium]
MDEEAVDEALRRWSELTREWMDSEEGRADMALRAREARRAPVDMSPSAIDARLREMADLSALCADLARAEKPD